MPQVIDCVRQIIADHLGEMLENVTEDKRVIKDLGADSLDVTEIFIELEKEFDLGVSIDAFNPGIEITVRDMIRVVNEAIDSNRGPSG